MLEQLVRREFNLLTQGFERNAEVKTSNFTLYNNWEENSPLLGEAYILDEVSQDRYVYETKASKRWQCLEVVLLTPIIHTVTTVVCLANRIVKIVLFAHFWWERERRNPSFKVSISEWSRDLLDIVLVPISLVGLELSAIYGLFRPYDGGKLFASWERLAFDGAVLAPHFQPEPKLFSFP